MHSHALVSKKDDPNYQQVSGHVPKDLAIRFKQHLAAKDKKLNEGLEEAITAYLAQEAGNASD